MIAEGGDGEGIEDSFLEYQGRTTDGKNWEESSVIEIEGRSVESTEGWRRSKGQVKAKL